MSTRSSERWKMLRTEGARALTALAIALVVAFAIVLATSKTPFETFTTLLSGPLTSKRTVGLWIDDVAKLTITGLAFSLVFQARQFAMGVQGQVYMGGLFSALVALSPVGSTWLGMPLAVLAGMAAGAFYGFIPGYAKARLGANEIVSSLMLNYIAINLVTYLVREPLVAGPGLLATPNFPPNVIFPALVPRTRIDLGLILAAVAVIATWFALYRTSWGLKLRLVGHNARFAEYAGIKATFIMVSAMTASGALGGLLGAMFVQGQSYGKLIVMFEGNLAFEGILIAIVAKARPLAVPVVAFFYGYLRQGALIMGIRTDVPTEVISVVQAVIILLVASSFSFGGKKLLARLFGPSDTSGTVAEART
ncbi:ABC transporter permease [Rhizobium alvei]|uniref:ABC transporter permease n=1 Tax=Rhizobium alvei TaxID=1132659 RepID=A0ABT8YSS1_9HYPH|nr:ABC transporter permease [Rhizobium alvei]MDO6966397.1 ABC transporter permease [Rhizobium alvei]